MRLLAPMFLAVLLTSCDALLVPAPDTVECTAIGCDSQVVFELTEIQLVAGRSHEIEACLDGWCETATVDPPQHGALVDGSRLLVSVDENLVALVLPEGDYAGPHTASLRIRPEGHDPFEIEVEIELERTQPNGPNCPPVCWQAVVEV